MPESPCAAHEDTWAARSKAAKTAGTSLFIKLLSGEYSSVYGPNTVSSLRGGVNRGGVTDGPGLTLPA
jgi:hypothetical protein